MPMADKTNITGDCLSDYHTMIFTPLSIMGASFEVSMLDHGVWRCASLILGCVAVKL